MAALVALPLEVKGPLPFRDLVPILTLDLFMNDLSVLAIILFSCSGCNPSMTFFNSGKIVQAVADGTISWEA
jgi:hypothetical protein